MSSEELESLIEELEMGIKIWRLHRWKRKLKVLMMEESEEKYFEKLRYLMRKLENILQLRYTGEELLPLTEKLERGEVLNADEVASLMRIEESARSEGREELLREVKRAFTKLGELTKNLAGEPEKMELKKGEI